MAKKILIGFAILAVGFFIFVSCRPGAFRYERSGLIHATPAKIYPYLSDFRLGSAWSPYEKIDENMKKTFSGPEKGEGSVMSFEGNRNVGKGRLEIIKTIPNQRVDIRLEMLEPMKGTNIIVYELTPEGSNTRFTWSMSGEGGFMSKLIGIFIDCEKMVGDQFSSGIASLTRVVESK